MKKISQHKDVLAEGAAVVQVTRATVRARARELALIAGRDPLNILQTDYEQAKRELTGEADLDRQDAILDALPEAKRWDPVPGSEGRRHTESPSEDEDEEGRSETEQMVDDGSVRAQHDKVFQAALSAGKKGSKLT
jgi:hypothetical protein